MIYLNQLPEGVLALNALWICVAILGAGVLATLAAGFVRGARLRRRIADLETRLEESAGRLTVAELLLADTTAEASQLRQRVDQLGNRQDSIATASGRSGFRQAIALSRHGATTRQLIDTCGLSQGEAHLIQTLYGRSGPDATETTPGEGLH